MSYRGPKARIMRRFGEAFTHSPKYDRILDRRRNPPGQHGRPRPTARMTEYGRRLFEKQKLKAIYNISEAQLVRYMREASRRGGVPGANLLQLLEQRLDNVVYRLGFAPTIWAARQLVNHGHFQVDERKVDIPSFLVQPGQVISLRERMRQNPQILASLNARAPEQIPSYLHLDRDTFSGTLLRLPAREEVPVKVNDTLIVEFYARR